MGEAARIVVLAARRRLPVVEVAAAAALERVLDLVAIGLILVAVLPYVARSNEMARGMFWSTATTIAVVMALVVMIIARRPIDRFVQRVTEAFIPRHAGAIQSRWGELSGGLAVMAQPGTALPVAAGAAAVWTLTVLLQWTVLRAFQPSAAIVDAAVMVAVVSIAGAIPAAPGAIGTYQWVAQQALVIPFAMRYTPASALAIAVVSHAVSYVFSTVLGALGLWWLGLSFASVRRAASRGHDVPWEAVKPVA
jgi:uncharacterized protein (TIRG00374 family)